MTSSEPNTAAGPVSARLYTQIQQFYTRQMGLLDDGRPDEWTDTFTGDGIFEEASRLAAPLKGRTAIRESARARTERVAAERLDFRHWLSMLHIEPEPDGSLRVRAYALAMRTPAGGHLDIFASVVMYDHLVQDDGRWQVRHRQLTHDGRSSQ